MQEHFLKVERTARVITLGELSPKTKQIWFVLHGYGQLASFFIKKFEGIASDEIFVVAPEAISRFYVKPYSRVGASWMTFDERQSEIDEYIKYLDDVFLKFTENIDLQAVSINIVGFSQGCVTACRWLNAGDIDCKKLLLCSGFFSNGLADVINTERVNALESYYIYGDKDEYLIENPVIAKAFQEGMQRDVPNMKIIEFEGGHTINVEIINQIAGIS
jgi:predicted esterase